MLRKLLLAISVAFILTNSHKVLGQVAAEKVDSTKYELHEWGVFTVPRDADWLKQDMLNEWQSFPTFFHGTLPKRSLAYRGPVTKPVMFFHAENELDINMYIHFSEGQPLIWWPPVEYPAAGSFGASLPKKLKDIHPQSYLHYSLALNKGGGIRAPVNEDHWVNHLRNVKSAPVFTHGSYSNFGVEQISEDFVYYDGLMKPPTPPAVQRTSNGLSITTQSRFTWLDVLVIERSYDRSTIKIGQIKKINANSQHIKLNMKTVDKAEFEKIVEQFKQKLTDLGLHQDEAQSLIHVWGEGLFERPGISIVHRIPQSVYDEWIPLHLDPVPQKTVRVGFVVHQNLEPELDVEVEKLIAKLGSNKYKEREAAERALFSIGGAAIKPIKLAAKSKDPEIADRANRLIKQLDTGDLLTQVMKRYQKSDNNPKK